MEIKILATGSSGNCYKITDGKTALLLECGLPVQKIKQGLYFGLFTITACLISHEHKDHCKAVNDIMLSGINVFMSEGTKKVLGLKGHRAKVIDKQTTIGTFEVMPFETKHDSEQPIGFLIYSTATKEKLIYASDTYYVTYKFNGLNYILLEVNYNADLLNKNTEKGLINFKQRERLLESHMSLENAVEFFKANDMSKVREIILIHLSNSNADEELIKKTIQGITGKQVTIARR